MTGPPLDARQLDTAPRMPEENSGTPSRKGRFWPWAVGGLLGITVLKYAIVLTLLANDPSIAIEEDYYRRAVAWDSERASRKESAGLGWQLQIAVGPTKDPARTVRSDRGEARLTFVDADGAPLAEAAISLRVFHHARAAERADATGFTDSAGVFTTPLPFARHGLWEVVVEATHDGQRFVETRTAIWGEVR